MKLSFTTLGCPTWSLDQIMANAMAYGFDAIDFRGVTSELNLYKLPEFADNKEETRHLLAEAGLSVSCFSSSVRLVAVDEAATQEIREYASLCSYFGVPFIRVFGGGIGQTDRQEAIRRVVRNAAELAPIAKEHRVKLLLETHDDWTACGYVREVMEQVDPEAIGVLWDVHHTFRTIGEQPAQTWDSLGSWIAYTHVKDSRLNVDGSGGFTYCLTGEGDIPLADIHRLLTTNGYNGYYTFEWEKRWHPGLEEPEVAFPHYVQAMRKLESEN